MLGGLTANDVRELTRMLGNLAGQGGDVPVRRRQFMVALAGLIGADIWYWVQSAGATATSNPGAFAFLTGGWQSERQQSLVVSSHHARAGELINAYFRQRINRHVTFIRADLIADNDWHASELYLRYYQPAGIDDFLMSAYPLPDNIISGLGFYRIAGAAAFSPRHRAMAHLVTAEVGWLHQGPTQVPAAAVVPKLSPRCREALLHLLTGDSRKQIARKLRVSEHTVSDYIKVLHRHFGVSSRGELMAKFLAAEAIPAASRPPPAG